MKRAKNSAKIKVMYPDGCCHEWETKPTAGIASDAVAFGEWLRETADSIIESATTQGQCAAKGEVDAQ